MADAAPPLLVSHGAPAPTGTFVVIRAAVAPMQQEPRVSSPQLSQALAGHVLLVHAEHGDWVQAAGVDGYPGWIHRGYTYSRRSGASIEARTAAPRRASAPPDLPTIEYATNLRSRTLSLGCTVRRAGRVRRLPLGALVEDVAGGAAADPDGPETVEGGETIALADRATRFPTDAGAVVDSATTLFVGTSYLWGGVTPWGADCSGFVQAIYRLHGCQLPRDAWQQALEGTPVAGPIAELEAGDLLYFSDRAAEQITHVGISLGGSRMAHIGLSRGEFAVERLDDRADPYVARLNREFRVARRVLGAGPG